MDVIFESQPQGLLFFGNEKSIVAVKSNDAALFLEHLDRVRRLFLAGKILNCKGWQLYQSYNNLPFDEIRIAENFHVFSDQTGDFNKPSDLDEFKKRLQ